MKYDVPMALICSRKSIFRTFILLSIYFFVLCEVIGGNRNFRFCEIVNKRDLTFSFPGLNLALYNKTLATCASLCVGLAQCSWFTYSVQLMTCLILSIPTFQNVGSGTIEVGRRHYALTVGKLERDSKLVSTN